MTRVLIVVGVRLYREGLVTLLDAQDGFHVVAAEATGKDAAARPECLTADVALIERGLPDLDALTSALAAQAIRIPLVILGTSDDETEVLACAESGAIGCVSRGASVEELTEAIRRAASGEAVCSPRTAGLLMQRLGMLAAQLRPASASPKLTRREFEVATLLRQDLSNKEIAVRLSIEVATVKNHVHNILEKLHLSRRSELARSRAHTMRSIS